MGTKIIFNYITVVILLGMPILAQANCFLVKEHAKALVSEGDCDSRHAPRCSFNIALSLMAFNEGILSSETKPEYPFKEGYPDYVARWQQPHNPSLWIKNSCVWYSHLITKELGQKKIQEYLLHFAYGNQDFSGDKGKDNALTRAWMSGSSLRISPNEQIIFLQKVVDRKLQVNAKSYQMTQNIFFVDELADGWRLYGKTGTGNLPLADGGLDENREGGWFVGWIEKGDRKIVFANYLEQTKQDLPAGGKAKEITIQRLNKLIIIDPINHQLPQPQ